MSYRVLIRRTRDGAEQWTEWYDWYGNDAANPGSILFSWHENNFSCDCNRHLEFERGRATSEDEDLWDEAECGDSAYDVVRIEDDAGRIADAATGSWLPAPAPTSTRTD